MDKLSAHQHSPKEAKGRKKKKKQIKVVYISNPMRFTASASEFKGLVQQFTGQDSDVAELSKFTGVDHYDDPSASADRAAFSTDDDSAALSRLGASSPGPQPRLQQQQQCEAYKFDAFDEVFTPQVLENLAAFMPSALCYEPPPPVM